MTSHRLLGIGALTALLSLSAMAQDKPHFEVGIKVGGGAYGNVEDSRSNPLGHVGVEFSAYDSGHAALFAEYSHWISGDSVPSSAVNSADLFGVGLRLQGTRRIRPFFDIGIAIGRDTYSPSYAGTQTRLADTTKGIVLGTGVTLPVGERFYLRPQFRVYPMSSLHIAASGEVGLGWRF